MLGKNIKLNDGTMMPQFGFGTWELLDDDSIQSILKTAYDLGYGHIDTAQIYNNEYAVGDFLINNKVSINEIYITTKVWVSNFGTRESFFKSIKQSLSRLGLTKVNLLLLHWGLSKNITIKAYKWLEEAKDEGLCDSIGVSNFNISLLKDIIEVANYRPVVNQVQFDLLDQQKELREYCKQNGIVVEGYSLLKPYLGSSSRIAMDAKQKQIVDQIGQKHNKTGPQIILRWALQNQIVIFPKSKNSSRIAQNSQIFEFNLSNDEMSVLNGMDKNPHQKMDDVINGAWDEMINEPLLFERSFIADKKNQSPIGSKLINDPTKKITR